MVDVRYKSKYHLRTLKEAGLTKCQVMCSREPRCLGFDFYIPVSRIAQGSCVLGTVDRLTLQRRLNMSEIKEGAHAEDLSRMKSVHCIHFTKTRRKGELMLFCHALIQHIS